MAEIVAIDLPSDNNVPHGRDMVRPQPGQTPGLSMHELERILTDMREEPAWRRESDRCCDYYDNKQLTAQQRADIEARGMALNRITLFAPDFGKYPNKVPFRIVYVPIIRARFLGSVSFALSLFLCLAVYVAKEGCDVIYENDVMYSLGGSLCAKLFSKKHFMNVHGFSPEEMEMGGHSRLRVKIVEFFQRTNYRLSNGLFCVTPYILEKVSLYYKIPKSKMVYIFKGIDAERCKPMEPQETLKTLGLEEGKHYVPKRDPWTASGFLAMIAVIKAVKSFSPSFGHAS